MIRVFSLSVSRVFTLSVTSVACYFVLLIYSALSVTQVTVYCVLSVYFALILDVYGASNTSFWSFLAL